MFLKACFSLALQQHFLIMERLLNLQQNASFCTSFMNNIYFLPFQIMYDMLYKSSSAGDPGTMCSNMNITNNINAKTKKVLDNFNFCKDFVEMETNAFIVAATMNHFKMKSLNDEVVPDSIKKSSKKEKCLWLHGQVKLILEKFVMEKQAKEHQQIVDHVNTANQPKQRPVFPCKECGKPYFYKKARDNHEIQKHNLSSNPVEPTRSTIPTESEVSVKEDHIHNYACIRLSMGMLIFNINDAVKEGDGERIVRCWKFMLLIFKVHNHHKYALALLQLLANTQALLMPEQAHSLVWNRTVNNRGGAGNNISLDLRMEHIVNLSKEMLGNLGANVNPSTALRGSRAIKPVEDLLSSIGEELNVRRPSGRHTVTRSQADFEAIVQELHTRAEVFAEKRGQRREFAAFPRFQRSMLSNLDYDKLNTWFNYHKKKWSRKGL